MAGANPPLWADILLANRAAVIGAIEDQAERLGEVAQALESGDHAWLQAFMEGAAAGRARLREAEPEVMHEPWRIVVAMPNRPGVISESPRSSGTHTSTSRTCRFEAEPGKRPASSASW